MQETLKELTSLGRKEKATTRNKKLKWKKLTGKGKHTVKVENHLYTDMTSKRPTERRGEHKCSILEMHLKLKDQQLKTILFLYRLLYQNLMVTANQKSTIDTQKRKRNTNTTLKLVIKSQEKRTKEEGKKKTNPKQLRKRHEEHTYQ